MFSLFAATGSSRPLSWLQLLFHITEPSTTNRNPPTRGCVIAGLVLLFLGGSFAVWWVSVVSAVLGSKEPWSLAEHLPETVVVLEEIVDQTGMDSFFLVKARFTSEDEITEICEEYHLLSNQDDVSPLSFAGLWAERNEIGWFPLPDVTRRYAFNSEKWGGGVKDGATGRYEAVIWIDDEKKVFILQLACL